jgi:hypothetical protein
MSDAVYKAVRQASDSQGRPLLDQSEDKEEIWQALQLSPFCRPTATTEKVFKTISAEAKKSEKLVRPFVLATMPICARAGTLLPVGPVKQHTSEPTDGSLRIWIYPGSDGTFILYEDDGLTFNYRSGQFMELRMDWNDRERRFTARLLERSRMLPPVPRKLQLRIVGESVSRGVEFDGRPLNLKL